MATNILPHHSTVVSVTLCDGLLPYDLPLDTLDDVVGDAYIWSDKHYEFVGAPANWKRVVTFKAIVRTRQVCNRVYTPYTLMVYRDYDYTWFGILVFTSFVVSEDGHIHPDSLYGIDKPTYDYLLRLKKY